MLVMSAMVVNEFRSTAGKTCRAKLLLRVKTFAAPQNLICCAAKLRRQRVRSANASFGVNAGLEGTPSWYDRVIDHFARKTRRAEFNYKVRARLVNF